MVGVIKKDTDRPRCRHCKLRMGGRARGLCYRCSLSAEIRRLYPCTSKYSKYRNLEQEDFDTVEVGHEQAGEPTDAAPGSEEKIEELSRRFDQRVSLFHKGDRRDNRKARIGVSGQTQEAILNALRSGVCRTGEIARRLGKNSDSYTSKALQAMARAGLVERVAHGIWGFPGTGKTSWGLDFDGWFGSE